jgi:hypothetical protein
MACLLVGAVVTVSVLTNSSPSAASSQRVAASVAPVFSPVGVWLHGRNGRFEFKADGSVVAQSGVKGRYTVSGVKIRFEWPEENDWIARDWTYDPRRDLLVFSGPVDDWPADSMRRASQLTRGGDAGVRTQQALDITGSWISYKGVRIRAVFGANWADRSVLSLPEIVDPDPPAVFAFVFRPDGSYSFVGGRGDVEWSSHAGRYVVARVPGNAVYPYQVTFSPDANTIKANRRVDRSIMPPGLDKLESGSHSFWLKADRDGGFDLLDSRARDLIGFFWLRRAQN